MKQKGKMSRKTFCRIFGLRLGGAGQRRRGGRLQRFQPSPLRGQGAKPSNLRAQSETRPETPNHEPQSALAPQTPNPNPQTRKHDAEKIKGHEPRGSGTRRRQPRSRENSKSRQKNSTNASGQSPQKQEVHPTQRSRRAPGTGTGQHQRRASGDAPQTRF